MEDVGREMGRLKGIFRLMGGLMGRFGIKGSEKFGKHL